MLTPEEEALYLRHMLQYAVAAPDLETTWLICQDALHGVTGADDCEAIRAAHRGGCGQPYHAAECKCTEGSHAV